jgi:hypothetical protein
MALMGWGWIAALFSMFIFQESFAGVAVEQLMRDREGNASHVFLYFSETKFRTDHPDGGLTMMIDFEGDRMVMVDHPSKCYVEIQFSLWEKEVAEKLKKSVPGIKPNTRKIDVKRTGETAIINSFRTVKVQVFADGELIEEHWVTRDLEMRDVEKVMEKVALSFSKEFKTEMKEGREIYEKLRPYGYSVLIKDYSIAYGVGGMNVLEVLKAEKRELKEEIFLPPAGYRRIVPGPSGK